jgi:hypothetical protein
MNLLRAPRVLATAAVTASTALFPMSGIPDDVKTARCTRNEYTTPRQKMGFSALWTLSPGTIGGLLMLQSLAHLKCSGSKIRLPISANILIIKVTLGR